MGGRIWSIVWCHFQLHWMTRNPDWIWCWVPPVSDSYILCLFFLLLCLNRRVLFIWDCCVLSWHSDVWQPPPYPQWPNLRCDVGLEEGEYWQKKLSLCYSVVYYYNGAQRYKQFSQVGRLLGFDLVKSSPKRPIMCRVGRWTLLYDVWQLNN